jgi:tRNA (guanine26-N2/guanine27-N2)-dimethyltransferase
MKSIREGAADISMGGAFYNPKMKKLRDISVMFLQAVGVKGASLLDTTAATGIRAIRYVKEAKVGDAVMLDINKEVAAIARKNAKRNKINGKALGKSLQEFAGSCKEGFDIIDIDPFGTPVPLIHDSLKVSRDGTLMMVTATDTATLCGAESDACIKNYACRPLHNELCHEVGLRILMNYVSREAAQFNFGIEPLLGISDMHYMRVFVRLRTGADKAVRSVKESGFGAYCNNCHRFSYEKGVVARSEEKCAYCGKDTILFGPVWLGNLQDKKLIDKMQRFESDKGSESAKLMEKIRNELDMPFFYSMPKITSYLKCSSVPLDEVIEALSRRHSASRTHFEENAVKTDATIDEVIRAAKGPA